MSRKLTAKDKKDGWVTIPDNATIRVVNGTMHVAELKRRLHHLNSKLSMVLYSKETLVKHRGMCSVTYRGEHLYSMKQGRIPIYPDKNYGTLDKFSNIFVVHMSVWKLGVKLAQRGLIKNPRELISK